MNARNSFLGTLDILKDCLNDPVLIDKAPSEVAHNQRAGMLRQGLAVLTFSAVETFLRERTGEVLSALTNRKLTFSDLSSSLQTAITVGALEGVRFRLKLQRPADKISWLVTNLAPIANATTDIQRLSDHSFGYAASNLDEGVVKDILKAFGVLDPWNQMTHLTRRVGLALPSCESEFETIKNRRHASAHALTSTVPFIDLQNSLKSSLAICLTFDLLLSHCLGLHNQRQVPGVSGNPKVSQSDIKLLFVEPRLGTNKFGVRREQSPPPSPPLARATIRVFSNEVDACMFAENYISSRQCQLVILESSLSPIRWTTWL
jgi:hypothetical protein